jgi:hypothetical protein
MALEVGGSDPSRATRTQTAQPQTPPAQKAETATPAATAAPVEKSKASQATVNDARSAFASSGAAVQNALGQTPTGTPPGQEPGGPGTDPTGDGKPMLLAGRNWCPRGGGKCTASNAPVRGLRETAVA